MVKTYGNISLIGDQWVIRCVPHVMGRIKRVFDGIEKNAHGALRLRDSPANARDLLWFMERYPMEVGDDDFRLMQQRAKFHADQVLAVEQILAKGDSDRVFDLAIPARDYQKVAAEIALRTGRLLIADEVGIGKTLQGICVATEPSARPMLVVTMTHLTGQWQSEFARFAPGLRTHVVKKGTPYAMDKWRGKAVPPPNVLIINYQKLAGWAATLGGNIKGLVFDEIQELRHTGSGKYSAAKHIASTASVRVGTSATPIFNFGGEMHNILSILAPTEIGTHAEFVREWGTEIGNGKVSIKDPKAFGDWLRDEGLMIRRTRADVKRELPPLTKIPHMIEANLSEIDKIATTAAELAKIILDKGGRAFDKMEAAAELDWRLRQATGIAKSGYVAEFVRILVESGENVLLFAWHHEVYALLSEKLREFNPVLYTGKESAAQKEASIQAFVSGESKVLLMSLRAGAGIDGLQKVCRTVVFAELDWSPAVIEQDIGRLNRDGQADPVVAYILIAECGSDPIIADTLGVKKRQLDGIRNIGDDVVGAQATDPDRIKRLAESFLHRHHQKVDREAVALRQELGQTTLDLAEPQLAPALAGE